MSRVIVLDRIEPGAPRPAYCVHGRATCMGGCGEWVWLGHASHDVVLRGQASPVCRPCAAALPRESVQLVGRVADHLRADGPHT